MAAASTIPSSSNVKSNSISIQRIKTLQERQKLELVNVYTTQIPPKQANSFLAFVSDNFPTPKQLDFLKRIRKTDSGGADQDQNQNRNKAQNFILEAIICGEEQYSFDEITALLEKSEFNSCKISVSQVPKFSPVTKDQFLVWRQVWPVSFHENKLLSVKFSAPELEYISKRFAEAKNQLGDCSSFIKDFSNSVSSDSNHHPNLNAFKRLNLIGCGCTSVCIADFKRLETVCQASDNTTSFSRSPLRHAVMNAIELVAKRNLDEDNICQTTTIKTNNQIDPLPPTNQDFGIGIGPGKDTSTKKRNHCDSFKDERYSLQNGSPDQTINITCEPKPEPEQKPKSECKFNNPGPRQSYLEPTISPNTLRLNNSVDKYSNYLCAGLDVFALKEPCTMCCMALVHSRINRLFYLESDPIYGGISKFSLNCLNNLNHSFNAFLCKLPE